MLQHYLQHTENRKPIWPKGLSMMFFWSDLQMLLWPWLLTSWPPKVDHFIPWPVDHLCQLASKSVFTHFQNIVLSVHKLVSTNGWTERQKYISLSEKEMTSYVSRWTLKPARSLAHSMYQLLFTLQNCWNPLKKQLFADVWVVCPAEVTGAYNWTEWSSSITSLSRASNATATKHPTDNLYATFQRTLNNQAS